MNIFLFSNHNIFGFVAYKVLEVKYQKNRFILLLKPINLPILLKEKFKFF